MIFYKSIIETQNINIVINGKIGSEKTSMINLILNLLELQRIENFSKQI